jgi:uncharacterized integral membrane protein
MTYPSDQQPASASGAAEPARTPPPADPGQSSSSRPSPDLLPPPGPGSFDLASSDLASPDLAPPSSDFAPPADPARRASVPRTRAGAVWFGVWAGVVALILLIIFVAQNTSGVEITFLWMHGRIPLALGLLIAGVCGAVIAMAVAAVRIIQLRRLVRRGR